MSATLTTDETLASLTMDVIANPKDDLPRLVMADRLDELGQTERAEFIRVGVQIAKWGCDFKQTAEQPGWKHNCGTDEKGYWLCQPLRFRERELLEAHEVDFLAGAPLFSVGWQANSTWVPEADWTWERGFVSRVELPLRWWVGGECQHCVRIIPGLPTQRPANLNPCDVCGGTGIIPRIGPEVVKAHPVEYVRLTDREPYWNGRGYCWYHADRLRPSDDVPECATLPPDLWPLLVHTHGIKTAVADRYFGWDGTDAAHNALSAAALEHARSVK